MVDERGFALVELLVAMLAATVVMLGIFQLVDISSRDSARVTRRVEADQTARPVLTRIIDELHSACVAPGATPVRAGSGDVSNDRTITFVTQTGSAVSPNPDKHVITFDPSARTLVENTYPYASGSAPNWTFSSTASSRTLLTNVSQATIGGSTVDVFRYYAYSNGQISSTQLSTPLTTATAATVAQVSVAFSVGPSANPANDSNSDVSVSDTALLRFGPAGEDPSEDDLPCT